MKIAILGGGLTGLTSAYYLSKDSNNTISVFEAEVGLGGLASGFKADNWDWSLERAYHHIFSSDKHIRDFLKEIHYSRVVFSRPITASLYENNDGFTTYAVDTPIQLLRFPLLNMFEKIRAGMALGAFKLSPFLPYYEKHTTEEILIKWMGKNAYETLFGEMFRKKFGKYAGNILASFIWSRIHMRTKILGYMAGGFQTMIDHVAQQCEGRKISIHKNSRISNITRTVQSTFDLVIESGGQREVQNFDIVISTLPSPVLSLVAKDILLSEEISKLQNLKYLSATNLVLEMEEKVFDQEYWVSLCTPTIPSLVFVQHTNFVPKTHYNNHNLLYIASYCEEDDALMFMSKEQQLELYLPTLCKLIGKEPKIHNSFLWRARFAQPIFSKEFLQNVPQFTTSVNNFYIANLDMTYPFDRGTNYAVKLGKDVAGLVLRGMKL